MKSLMIFSIHRATPSRDLKQDMVKWNGEWLADKLI